MESNHTSRGRPLPARNHKEVETREREREAACAPLGEQVLSLAACSCFITGLVVEYGSPIASIPNEDHKSPKDVNRSSVIAKHVHRWFPVTVASQALTGQTIGRYTLWVLGFIEKQIGQRPQCKPLGSGSGGGVDSLRRHNNSLPLAQFWLCSLPNCDFSLSKNN